MDHLIENGLIKMKRVTHIERPILQIRIGVVFLLLRIMNTWMIKGD